MRSMMLSTRSIVRHSNGRDHMTYCLLQRTHDSDTGLVHIKDPCTVTLSVCVPGFAASSLNMDGKHTAVPTCVFCIAGMPARLPQWRFLTPGAMYRRVIEENLFREP